MDLETRVQRYPNTISTVIHILRETLTSHNARLHRPGYDVWRDDTYPWLVKPLVVAPMGYTTTTERQVELDKYQELLSRYPYRIVRTDDYLLLYPAKKED